eukprot:CAMPEP_0179862008 /NCGR_PEP_ID=MMETSP0982-20121206/14594_1 /TAXON_ID=483367 /ORGANISM="non described non described, Strain CCMP 2436" /LENGTH=132 /DNA_ID=CAMNT_0021749645 /DNA_START=165 /DNA_END=563 /DNA_ORIENTATION=-
MTVDILGTDDLDQVGIRRDQHDRLSTRRRGVEAARTRSSCHAAPPMLPGEFEVGAVRSDDAARLLERTRCPRPRPAAPGLVGWLMLAVAALVHPGARVLPHPRLEASDALERRRADLRELRDARRHRLHPAA